MDRTDWVASAAPQLVFLCSESFIHFLSQTYGVCVCVCVWCDEVAPATQRIVISIAPRKWSTRLMRTDFASLHFKYLETHKKHVVDDNTFHHLVILQWFHGCDWENLANLRDFVTSNTFGPNKHTVAIDGDYLPPNIHFHASFVYEP